VYRSGRSTIRTMLPVKGLLFAVCMLHVVALLTGSRCALMPLFDAGATDVFGPSLSGNRPGDALLPEQRTGVAVQESDLRRADHSGRRGSLDKQVLQSSSSLQRVRLASFFHSALHSTGRMPGMPGVRSLFHRKTGGSEADDFASVPV